MPQPTLRTVPLNGRSSFSISEFIAVSPVEMCRSCVSLKYAGSGTNPFYKRHKLLPSRGIGALASGHSRGNAHHVGADLPVSCPWIVTIAPLFTSNDPTGSRGNRQRDAITKYLFNHRFTNLSVKPARTEKSRW